MASYRIYHSGNIPSQGTVTLEEEASHHLARVLRANKNEEVKLFNGNGKEYKGFIAEISKTKVTVILTEISSPKRESPLTLHLAQGISRSDRMDLILQKAVELGVTHITPLITERVNIKQDSELLQKKFQHWQKVMISACEQCGRNTLPELSIPTHFKDFFDTLENHCGLLLDPQSTISFKKINVEEKPCILLIGPEGGLSTAEIDFAVSKSFTAISLGPRILRTETAALAALTLAQGLWGDL